MLLLLMLLLMMMMLMMTLQNNAIDILTKCDELRKQFMPMRWEVRAGHVINRSSEIYEYHDPPRLKTCTSSITSYVMLSNDGAKRRAKDGSGSKILGGIAPSAPSAPLSPSLFYPFSETEKNANSEKMCSCFWSSSQIRR